MAFSFLGFFIYSKEMNQKIFQLSQRLQAPDHPSPKRSKSSPRKRFEDREVAKLLGHTFNYLVTTRISDANQSLGRIHRACGRMRCDFFIEVAVAGGVCLVGLFGWLI